MSMFIIICAQVLKYRKLNDRKNVVTVKLKPAFTLGTLQKTLNTLIHVQVIKTRYDRPLRRPRFWHTNGDINVLYYII